MSKTKYTEGKLSIYESSSDDSIYLVNDKNNANMCTVESRYSTDTDKANAARLVKCWNEYDSLVKALSDLVKWVETKEVNETPGYSFSQAKSILKLIKQSEQ